MLRSQTYKYIFFLKKYRKGAIIAYNDFLKGVGINVSGGKVTQDIIKNDLLSINQLNDLNIEVLKGINGMYNKKYIQINENNIHNTYNLKDIEKIKNNYFYLLYLIYIKNKYSFSEKELINILYRKNSNIYQLRFYFRKTFKEFIDKGLIKNCIIENDTYKIKI